MSSAMDDLLTLPETMDVHQPVLYRELLEAMESRHARTGGGAGVFLDGTFGAGGHSRGLLEMGPEVRVIAMDRDPDAGRRAALLKEEYGARFEFHDMNFADIGKLELEGVDGACFDLGVSSHHFDEGARGFSFRKASPLDMRMDPRRGRSAAEFLETAKEEEIVEAVRDFGEEPAWRKIVRAILENRGTGKLGNTLSFAALIEEVSGKPHGSYRHQRIHPATRTFQGVRIAVNGELEALERMLPAVFEKLNPGGVLAIISFHSLEDRMVKRFMRRMAGRPEHGRDNRTQEERTVRARLIGNKPIRPSEEEIRRNPRSRSAIFRLIEKLETTSTA